MFAFTSRFWKGMTVKMEKAELSKAVLCCFSVDVGDESLESTCVCQKEERAVISLSTHLPESLDRSFRSLIRSSPSADLSTWRS